MNINLLIIIASFSAIVESVMKSPILNEAKVGDRPSFTEPDPENDSDATEL